jgi:Ni/Fe-hydrogenase subunit HybB-like protein
LFLVMVGLIFYRWDTNMVGQLVVFSSLPQGITPLYTQYKPALIEIVIGAGVIAYALLAFTIGVRYLKVVQAETLESEDVVVAPALMSSAD